MTLSAEREARVDIDVTLRSYVDAVDRGRIEELVGLFEPDGVLAPHGLAELRGRRKIAEFLAASRRSRSGAAGVGTIRHHVTGAHVELRAADFAVATSYFTAMSAIGVDHWGVYRDEVRSSAGIWLFARRAVTLEGADSRGWIGSGAGVVKFDGGASAVPVS